MPKRPQPADKAHELLQHRPGTLQVIRPVPLVVKITTKILSEQVEWLRQQMDRYGVDHPRAPRLTMEEVMQIAIDELRNVEDLDAVIRRYRS